VSSQTAGRKKLRLFRVGHQWLEYIIVREHSAGGTAAFGIVSAIPRNLRPFPVCDGSRHDSAPQEEEDHQPDDLQLMI